MYLLIDAWNGLKRNQPAVFAYILLTVLFVFLYRGGNLLLRELSPEGDMVPLWLPVGALAMDVLIALAIAATQATCFAAIGREFDRPLWKCESHQEALRRFFLPWFILNLITVTLVSAREQAALNNQPELAVTLEFIILLAFLFAIPIGACVMYWGRLDWNELGESLLPIARQFPLVLIVLAVNFLQFLLHILILTSLPEDLVTSPATPALLNIPFAVLDLIAFAAMWRVCMIHRDTDTGADDDFDF